MKLGELYVHIYYYALNNIFLYKIIMHAWRNECNIVAILQRCTVTVLNLTSHIFRGSAVGSALDLESKICWVEPTVRHYFSSNNVRIAIFTGGDPQSE